MLDYKKHGRYGRQVKSMYRHIRDLREDRDLSQQEMADILHTNQSAYSRYESGEREIPLESLIALAYYHDVSVDYLLGLTNIKKPYPRVVKK